MADFEIAQGDTGPPLIVQLTDWTGVAANLTGATIAFHMADKPDGTGNTLVTAAATVFGTPTNGQAQYSWIAADTATPGDYFGEFQVTYAGGMIVTFPNDEADKITITVHPAEV